MDSVAGIPAEGRRRETTKMISRNLSRRLDRLETHLRPADELLTIQVRYVSPDGSVVDGPRFTSGAGPNDLGPRTRPWQQKSNRGTATDITS